MSDSIQTESLEDMCDWSPVGMDTAMITRSRLPEFDRSDFELWFARREHYSMRHNTKYEGICPWDLYSVSHHLISKEVRDFILSPPNSQPHTTIGREIMIHLWLSDGQRIHRLF
ncbi:hypothetical protein Smp_122190 [Schistosoma mansoni]|uniref:Uncharacterized protein n=1 Tax=Schistosoma mansoni TaxID=6183 RepID=G4LVT3_SCHMA|nr:hypothetical protein Smp_122190 [Schistosoma mansoni]|eukprot:XP_018645380.1 hypothetical protein Smp_122190 [Schistosoma mansoni]